MSRGVAAFYYSTVQQQVKTLIILENFPKHILLYLALELTKKKAFLSSNTHS